MRHRRILVTGGAGFIGSALVRMLIGETGAEVCNVDALTYAGNLSSLGEARQSPRHQFHQIDICDGSGLARLFDDFRPDAVMHLAAESHVDRSIAGPAAFVRTNASGTSTLLEVSTQYWSGLAGPGRDTFRFLHVSTDEVFGSLGHAGHFDEASPYDPSSPYSASKAASDHMVRAWRRTYGLPVVISTSSNNYGPCQHPEKLIPKAILAALAGQPIPIYGRGDNVRDWLHVEDHARALLMVLEQGRPGETYCIGGGEERSNIEVVQALCDCLDQLRPRSDGKSHRERVTHVADRPGHDFRYAIDAAKARSELGWVPRQSFGQGIAATVQWYLDNEHWWREVLSSPS